MQVPLLTPNKTPGPREIPSAFPSPLVRAGTLLSAGLEADLYLPHSFGVTWEADVAYKHDIIDWKPLGNILWLWCILGTWFRTLSLRRYVIPCRNHKKERMVDKCSWVIWEYRHKKFHWWVSYGRWIVLRGVFKKPDYGIGPASGDMFHFVDSRKWLRCSTWICFNSDSRKSLWKNQNL